MFGYASQKIKGQPVSSLIPFRFHHSHPESIIEFGKSDEASRKMGEQRAIFGINSKGQEFPIEASISKTEVEDHKYFAVIMRDISLRLQQEKQKTALNQ